MKRSKKLIAVIMATILLVSLLAFAGCGQTTGGGSNSKTVISRVTEVSTKNALMDSIITQVSSSDVVLKIDGDILLGSGYEEGELDASGNPIGTPSIANNSATLQLDGAVSLTNGIKTELQLTNRVDNEDRTAYIVANENTLYLGGKINEVWHSIKREFPNLGELLAASSPTGEIDSSIATAEETIEKLFAYIAANSTEMNQLLSSLKLGFDADDVVAALSFGVKNLQGVLASFGINANVQLPETTGSIGAIFSSALSFDRTKGGYKASVDFDTYLTELKNYINSFKAFANLTIKQLIDSFAPEGATDSLFATLSQIDGTKTIGAFIAEVEPMLTAYGITLDPIFEFIANRINASNINPDVVFTGEDLRQGIETLTLDELTGNTVGVSFAETIQMVQEFISVNTIEDFYATVAMLRGDIPATYSEFIATIVAEINEIISEDIFDFKVAIFTDKSYKINAIEISAVLKIRQRYIFIESDPSYNDSYISYERSFKANLNMSLLNEAFAFSSMANELMASDFNGF